MTKHVANRSSPIALAAASWCALVVGVAIPRTEPLHAALAATAIFFCFVVGLAEWIAAFVGAGVQTELVYVMPVNADAKLPAIRVEAGLND